MPAARMALLGVMGLLMSAAPAGAETLVHHWKGDDDAVDSVAANNGAWHGTEAYTTGVVNKAFSFDGASYVTAPPVALPGEREKAPLCRAFEKWAILDSNQGPLPYQRSALTD